jgi:nucleoside-diphosphate-sugar epimerase
MKMSFEIVFEIYFSTAEEYMGLLNELVTILQRPGARIVLTSSGLVYGDENILMKINFSEESTQNIQISFIRGLLKAVGRIECREPVRCVDLFQHVYEIIKNRKIRFRII